MREVKFKFWDGVDYMSNPYTLHEILLNNSIQFTKDCIQLQYTGLKDKNGKEIYEGDVVKVEDVLGNPLDGWRDGVYKVEYALPDCAFCLVQLDGISGISFNEVLEYEIIGNIYENPELLNP